MRSLWGKAVNGNPSMECGASEDKVAPWPSDLAEKKEGSTPTGLA